MLLLKIGGGEKINFEYIARDVKNIIEREQVIIVQGANHDTDKISRQLDYAPKTITSPSGYTSRYTDQRTMEILTMVYSGLVNKKIVASLQQAGVNALGLSGVDGGLLKGERKQKILSVEDGKTKVITDDYTGKVTSVNHRLLSLLLSNGYTPVICLPALSENNEMINFDNDRVCAKIAEAMNIKTIVSLFEAPGFLKDASDQNSLLKTLSLSELLANEDSALGRMKKKILGAKEAFAGGVEKIYWADGRQEYPVSRALNGEGTIICADS
ncbi:MAG: [LysW]-aminoadipate kinase [Candidatus Komeilibacteria bacterium]|nr:[LysW]-aminoadipate kinase [Candidatus Komeilibacteria bacterium]